MTCTIIVHPDVVERPESAAVVAGDGTEFTCVFEGQPNITWFHDGDQIEQDLRVCVTENTTDDGGLRSTLTIKEAEVEDSGNYSCSAVSGVCDPVNDTVNLEVKGELIESLIS